MLAILCSSHKGFMTLHRVASVSPSRPTPKGSRLPKSREDSALLPGIAVCYLRSLHSPRAEAQIRKEPSLPPPAPPPCQARNAMEQQFFPAPTEHSRRGRERSALEEESEWRTLTGEPARTVAQPWTFCPWGGFLVLPGIWRK